MKRVLRTWTRCSIRSKLLSFRTAVGEIQGQARRGDSYGKKNMTQWIVPVYELTDRGVLMKTGAEDPGRATATSPDGCFDLKLGTSVRASYGEGVVLGAQCTPSELTQYRVEKPDGERFWARRNELKTR